MDIITINTSAALRSRSESPFVVPSGAMAYWHLASLDVPTGTASVNNPPMAARDARTTTKQARPPRGEPR